MFLFKNKKCHTPFSLQHTRHSAGFHFSKQDIVLSTVEVDRADNKQVG